MPTIENNTYIKNLNPMSDKKSTAMKTAEEFMNDYANKNGIGYVFGDMDKKEIFKAMEEYASQKTGWVDCKDDYPKDYEHVICLTADGTVLELMYCDDTDDVGMWHNISEHFKQGATKKMGLITHWMPKPELPSPPQP